MLHVRRSIKAVSLWILVFLGISNASPLGGGWFGSNGSSDHRKWSSMLEIDPAKMVSIMMKHGGLLIPKSSKKDLEVFAKVCKADRVRLNVIKRKLEVQNFVVQLPGEEEALRIGRVYIQWDSYLKPCIEVAVDDVSMLVEFFNLILTRTNWDELKKNGFPPEFADEEETPTDSRNKNQAQQASSYSSFVRIGSIDLSGNIVAVMKSRPLKKELAEVRFALDTFDPLDDQIKAQSLENLANTGQRGCTTDELYTLIQKYVSGILKQVLADTFDDVTSGGTKTSERMEKVVSLTKKSVSKYINESGEWSGQQLQDNLSSRLKKWGLTTDDEQSKQAVSILASRLKKVEGIQELSKRIPFFNNQKEDERTTNSDKDS